MKPTILTLIVLALMLSSALAVGLTAPSVGANPIMIPTASSLGDEILNDSDDQEICITAYYFYGIGCPHCAIIAPYIDSIVAKYPKQLDLTKLEIYYDSANQALFYSLNARYGVNDPVVPTIFIADQALVGEDAIKRGLEPALLQAIEDGKVITPPEVTPPDGSTDPQVDNGTGSGSIGPSKDLTIAMVIGASLADSINPCAISVMVFLLMFMTGLGDRRKVLYVGIAYVVTVFIVYFVAGLGMLTFLQSTSMTRHVYFAAAGLSIAFGLVNIKDFFVMGKKATLAIPESRKPMIKRYIEKASVPAAVMLGFMVSLFELPCTGGVYLAILSLLSNNMTMAEGIPYLALYNAIFVLPLGVILAFFYKGASPEKINSWRLEKRRVLRLMLGVVMLLLGAVMLYEAL